MTRVGFGSCHDMRMRMETTRCIDSPRGGTGGSAAPVSGGSGGQGVAWLALRATPMCGGSSVPTHRGGEVVRWASHGEQRRAE
jgi:hypothetical protein